MRLNIDEEALVEELLVTGEGVEVEDGVERADELGGKVTKTRMKRKGRYTSSLFSP